MQNTPSEPNPSFSPDLAFRVRGHWLRIASLQDEWFTDTPEPAAALEALSRARTRADLYTFVQRLPDVNPRYPNLRMEWDNVAAIPISTFEHWWNEQIPKSSRKHIRRSERAGVVCKLVPLGDDLLEGISAIYNETPLRQGRPFSHYGEDMDTLRKSHSTFPGRRDFIGAYFNEELIGFTSLTYAGQTARSVQMITKRQHQDKWPTNALIAKAVEVCVAQHLDFLVYGRFDYGKVDSASLQSFKSENGFVKMLVPRYYIPINSMGRLALSLGLHRGLAEIMPRPLIQLLMNCRVRWYRHLYRTQIPTRLNGKD